MGNRQFKCPSETSPGPAPFTCVMTCPSGFELKPVDGAPRCVSKDDPEVSIHLIPQTAVSRPLDDNSLFSIEDLKTSNPDSFVRYSAEFERFNAEKVVAIGNIDHGKEVKAASEAVLAAAGKDSSIVDAAAAKYLSITGNPDAAAYTIDKGIKNDLQKSKSRFIDEYHFLSNQSKQQQSTMDLISSVKDNLFMVKDDLEFSVGTFDKQISDIQNQINMNKRKQQQAVDYGSWMMMGLNIAIVLALLFAVFVLGRVVMTKVSSSSGASPPTPEPNPDITEVVDNYYKALAATLGNANRGAAERPAKRGWLW